MSMIAIVVDMTQSGTANATSAAFARITAAANATMYMIAPRRKLPGRFAAATGPDAPLETASSTRAMSAARCGRASGSFSRHCMTISASAGGVSGRSSDTGCGFDPMCAASSLCGDRSANGGRPASISYAMHPNE